MEANVGAMHLRLGASVRCDGAVVGHAVDVVVDPARLLLTHVAVENSRGVVRLVPIKLIDGPPDRPGALTLSCSEADLRELEPVRQFARMAFDEFPAAEAEADVGVQTIGWMPYLEDAQFGDYVGPFEQTISLTYDLIPKGDAELGRSSPVISAEGEDVGHVEGLLVDEGRITHVVLEQGHLWRTRDVAVPVDVVASIKTDAVAVRLTKAEIAALDGVKQHRFHF